MLHLIKSHTQARPNATQAQLERSCEQRAVERLALSWMIREKILSLRLTHR